MPTLIKDGQVIENPWCLLEKGVDLTCCVIAKPSRFWSICPYGRNTRLPWRASKNIGVGWIVEDDPYELASDVIDCP